MLRADGHKNEKNMKRHLWFVGLFITTIILVSITILSRVYPQLNFPHPLYKRDGNGDDGDKNKDKDKSKERDLFCAVKHPVSGTYIDLSPLSTKPNLSDEDGKDSTDVNGGGEGKKMKQDKQKKTRWAVSGWDYTSNFTMGICSSALDSTDPTFNHTGAFYYEDTLSNTNLQSIGDYSTKPFFVGKKLVLEYDNGSLCPNGIDHKSTILNFVCSNDESSNNNDNNESTQINFIGSLHNCSYFFEVKSIHACPTSASLKQDINVIGIFLSILFVFIIVELGRRKLLKIINKKRLSSGGGGGSGGNTNNYSGNGIYLNGNNSFGSTDSIDYLNYINPRWANIEHESKVKMFFKKIINTIGQHLPGSAAVPTATTRNANRSSSNYKLRSHDVSSPSRFATTPTPTSTNNNNNNNNYSDNSTNTNSNRISRGSNETLFRNMELQNELIDSLQVDTSDDNNNIAGDSIPSGSMTENDLV